MRNIAVNLTDDECKKLAELCAAYNITVSALIEKFIKDAIQTRDSDEKLFAERYIERAYSYPEQTLLWHLISNGYDPEFDFLSCIDDIEINENDLKYIQDHQDEANEEAEYLEDDIASLEEDLRNMLADFKQRDNVSFDEEIEIIRKWISDRDQLLDDTTD